MTDMYEKFMLDVNTVISEVTFDTVLLSKYQLNEFQEAIIWELDDAADRACPHHDHGYAKWMCDKDNTK